MEEETIEPTKLELYQQKLNERAEKLRQKKAEQDIVKVSWSRIIDEPAVESLLTFIRGNRDRHLEVAKDGVGVGKQSVDPETGAIKQGEVIYLDHERRISELDRASGCDEIYQFILRYIAKDSSSDV